MQKQEFEEKIERTVTDEQYKVIEEVYMWHPSIRNTSGKDEVAELYKSFGMTIFHVELMSILLKLQEQTSPIRMSIGYTVGGTVRQGIILYEAAPKVIETLIEKGYTCDLNGCGMRVYKL